MPKDHLTHHGIHHVPVTARGSRPVSQHATRNVYTDSGVVLMAPAQAAVRVTYPEAEEQREPLVPQLQRRRRASAIPWPQIALVTLLVSGSVGALVMFVNTYARIAEYEIKRQALKQQYTQLNRECIELNLELERLAALPRLTKVAQAKGLDLPAPDRVHYLKGAQDYPRAALARATPASRSSWVKRSGQQLVAALSTTWHVLGGSASSAAYAQD